jgi:hypothetical protein
MKTYCLHHTPAEDRKKYLLENFDTTHWHWITDFLPTDDFIINHTKVYSEHSANGQGFLNNAELSLFYKHKLAIELISKEQNYGIILEDDIESITFDLSTIICIFIQLMKKENTDILFIGSYGSLDVYFDKPSLLCKDFTLSRCAHAYIVNNKCSIKLLKYLSVVKAPIDWQLNYAIKDLKLKSCWSYPHLYQRSEKKQTISLLR